MVHAQHLSRRTILRASLVPVVAGAAAVLPKPARAVQGNEIVLEYWQAFQEYPSIAEIRARFSDAHPGVRVETTLYNNYLELVQALQTAAAAGRLPALAGVGNQYVRFAVENLPHLSLDDAQEFDGDGVNYLADGFAPNLLGLGQVDGVQHGMPFVIGTPYLIYNADLFSQAGLDRAPETWNEVREFSRTINEETTQYGLWIQEPAGFFAHQALIESNGATLLVAEPGEQPRTGIGSPESIEALQFHADMTLLDETAVHLAFREGEQSFIAGQIGMIIATGTSLQSVQSTAAFAIGTAPFPTFDAKPRRVAAAGNNLVIFATEDETQRAAWEFVKFATSPDSLTLLTEDTGFNPSRPALIDDPEYLKPFYDANPLYQPEREQIGDAVTQVNWPGQNGPEAEQAVIDLRARILSGSQDVASAATETAERIDELIQE